MFWDLIMLNISRFIVWKVTDQGFNFLLFILHEDDVLRVKGCLNTWHTADQRKVTTIYHAHNQSPNGRWLRSVQEHTGFGLVSQQQMLWGQKYS